MPKPKIPIYFYPSLLVIGMGAAWVSLLVNQEFQVTLSLASMFSPTGAKVLVGGFRIKHWVVGVIVGFIGVLAYFIENKHTHTKAFGAIMAGAGALLILDEYEAIIRTITTGQYP